VLLIGALITSYYLQIKRIRAVHETVVSIFAGELDVQSGSLSYRD
jgi:sodium/hydrogen exchanger-like protein 6/7